jgi:hypothetical protein
MRARAPHLLLLAAAAILCASRPTAGLADSKSGLKADSKADAKAEPKAEKAAAAPARATPGSALSFAPALPGMAPWHEPVSYSVDVVMKSGDQTFTMRRFIDQGHIRTEMDTEGQQMVMLERPEDKGAYYTLMPAQKMAMKLNPAAVAAKLPEAEKEKMAGETASQSPEGKVERVGGESFKGKPAVKYRFSGDGGTGYAWFDAATSAPLRMEFGDASIEWQNMKVGAQPAKLYELPKDYQVTDMEEMMKQAQSMQGVGANGALNGLMGGKRGMMAGALGVAVPGGAGGLSGIAGQAGSNLGSHFGSSLGGTLGASFGGPLGGMAGQFLGGKIGGWLGKKAAGAVTGGGGQH